MLKRLLAEMKTKANPGKAKAYAWFFKTGKGEYGEGDVFLGLTVPEQRVLAKKYAGLGLHDIKKLLASKYHEHRLTGLLLLVGKYQKCKDNGGRKEIADFYLGSTYAINNWDLVDLSASKILGNYLLDKNRKILYKLAKSKNLWERRIAVIASGAFIWKDQFDDTIRLAEMLINDRHDLIHKAMGWMLREVGKRDEKVLLSFLDKHHKNMPRTMLRYAIEKLDMRKRRYYLAK